MNVNIENAEFFAHLLAEICDYAVNNGYQPDRILENIAIQITDLLSIATFNDWKVTSNDNRL